MNHLHKLLNGHTTNNKHHPGITHYANKAQKITNTQTAWLKWQTNNTANSAINGPDTAALHATKWAHHCNQLKAPGITLNPGHITQPHQWGLIITSCRHWLLTPPTHQPKHLTRSADIVLTGAKLRAGQLGQIAACPNCPQGRIWPGTAKCDHCGAHQALRDQPICPDCLEALADRPGPNRTHPTDKKIRCDRCSQRKRNRLKPLGPINLRNTTECEHFSQITRFDPTTEQQILECKHCSAILKELDA